MTEVIKCAVWDQKHIEAVKVDAKLIDEVYKRKLTTIGWLRRNILAGTLFIDSGLNLRLAGTDDRAAYVAKGDYLVLMEGKTCHYPADKYAELFNTT